MKVRKARKAQGCEGTYGAKTSEPRNLANSIKSFRCVNKTQIVNLLY